MVSTPAQVRPLSTVGGGWWGGGGNGKHTRSSAPAQRCLRVAQRGGGWVGRRGNGEHMPATLSAYPLTCNRWGAVLGKGGVGVGAGAGRGGAHPLTRVRLALHPRLPPNKHTRSRAPAQRCTHACHLISTPTHVQHMPAALMSACSGWAGLGSGFGEVSHTRSHTPAQHCAHACHLASAPAHA